MPGIVSWNTQKRPRRRVGKATGRVTPKKESSSSMQPQSIEHQHPEITERLDRIEAILVRVLATLDSHDRTLREILTVLPTLGFRWPWERVR